LPPALYIRSFVYFRTIISRAFFAPLRSST